MRNPAVPNGLGPGGGRRGLFVACLVLFPLFFLPAGTSLHPGLGGDTPEQVRQLADQAPRWRMVHLSFGLAALLALGAVVAVWRLTAAGLGGSPELKLFAGAAGLIGVAGAGALVWVSVWETRVVPELAQACVSSGGCLDGPNRVFLERLAAVGWRQVPFLLEGGVLLALGLFLLGPLGWRAKALRPWEALGISAGGFLLLLMAPSIHGDSAAGLLLVLVGTGSLAVRLLRRTDPVPVEPAGRL